MMISRFHETGSVAPARAPRSPNRWRANGRRRRVLPSLNLSAYVGNDPVNATDPLGLCKVPQLGWKEPIEPGSVVITANYICYEMPPVVDRLTVIAPDSGGGGGGGSTSGSLPAEKKKLSQCMINFLGSQGYNTKGLSDVTFYKGTLIGQSVYNTMGNPAITVGNSIHVATSAWSRISTPSGGATFFEEIIHTRQYESWGLIGFAAAYGVASAMGKYNTGSAHNNPVEQQAIALSNQLLRAYNGLPASKRCPD